MKKLMTLVLCLGFVLSSACAFAVGTPDEARKTHRQEMKKVKDGQREAKKNEPVVSKENQKPGFWEKEGERSGLGNSGGRVGNFLGNLNPVPFFQSQDEQYKARKAANKTPSGVTVKK